MIGGTGLAGAVAVGQQMRQVLESTEGSRECHVIHLGDVYDSGIRARSKLPSGRR